MKHPRDQRAPGFVLRAFSLRGLAAAGVIVFLCACRVFPEWETIVVVPPSLPTAWSERGLEPEWEFRAFWPGGEIRSAPGSGESAAFLVPRDERVAVLAYPIVRGRSLRPAGVVRPLYGFPAGKVDLTWAGGYQAEAARVLIRAGGDPSRFDLDRFLSEALDRMDDPWDAPPETFAARLADGTFRANWLNPPEEYEVGVSELPGPAASESPFGVALVPDGRGTAAASLSIGVHSWYASWGRVSSEVFEDGSVAWIVVSGP